MPRVKEFNKADALNKAMEVFWEKGYYDTSIDDIVTATRVSRSGLYGTFGGKKALFIKTLDLYRQKVMVYMMGRLLEDDASLEDIFKFFDKLRAIGLQGQSKYGCYFCNTITEIGASDIEVASRMTGYIDIKRTVLRKALINAQNNKELSLDIDVDAMADYLTNTAIGIAVVQKSSLVTNMVDHIVDTALAPLKKGCVESTLTA